MRGNAYILILLTKRCCFQLSNNVTFPSRKDLSIMHIITYYYILLLWKAGVKQKEKVTLMTSILCFVIFYAFLRISLCMNVIPLQYLVKDPFCHLEQPTDHQHRREGFHKDGSEQRERSLNLHLHPNQPLSGCTHCRHSRVSLQGRWKSHRA